VAVFVELTMTKFKIGPSLANRHFDWPTLTNHFVQYSCLHLHVVDLEVGSEECWDSVCSPLDDSCRAPGSQKSNASLIVQWLMP